MPFTSLGLHPLLIKQVAAQGYTSLTPIQNDAMPSVMEGRDLMGLAPTGTGKTAAFVLPILHKLLQSQSNKIRGLILTPTRELAEQINEVVRTFASGTGLCSGTIYGGVSFGNQVRNLRRGADMIVACPGRLLDHMQQRTIDLSAIEVLVLDEADLMFDMGFLPSIKNIVRQLPKERQNLMFSATMPDKIRSLAQEMLRNPKTVQVANTAPVETVTQSLLPIGAGQKTALLLHLVKDIPAHESVLVFTKTKHKAKKIGVTLKEGGFKATSLQGNLAQNKRQAAMRGFRDGQYQIMVATDIASRGIDISQIFHVINYDMPDTVEAYTHRIGRTGRACRTGAAYTFVTSEDVSDVRIIERTLKTTIPRLAVDGFNYNGEEQQFHHAETRRIAPAPRSDRHPRPGPSRGNRRRNPQRFRSGPKPNFSGASSSSS